MPLLPLLPLLLLLAVMVHRPRILSPSRWFWGLNAIHGSIVRERREIVVGEHREVIVGVVGGHREITVNMEECSGDLVDFNNNSHPVVNCPLKMSECCSTGNRFATSTRTLLSASIVESSGQHWFWDIRW
ncbi:hypothetical protein BJ165DRAFT_1404958 [Panaeolus papilionaceus]|nr:hypothetical protein BJ165DRAFT_1404958 [Panaeolus papilionaceus]